MSIQRTLKDFITVEGIGVHSGAPARMTLKPAKANTGIQFIRTDLQGAPRVHAHYKNVVNTQMATTLAVGKVAISTVEHVLAALMGVGIDNALIEVSGPEIPIMDGSSAPFYEALCAAGTLNQLEPRPTLILKKRVELKLKEKWATVEPSDQFEIHESIEWDHPAIGYQEYHYIQGDTDFADLASARTFGFLKEVEALRAKGLARGGSFNNAVVLDDHLILNPGGLRFSDEFVRHKVLDAMGDFKLSGFELLAKFRLHRAGHDLHHQLLMAIFKDPNNYEILSEDRDSETVSDRQAALVGRLAQTYVG